jgi:large subunit ribosomal protein L24
MNVHKDDMVLVIAGKDRNTRARVRQVIPGKGQVVVEGVNIRRKHTRGRGGVRQAGIVEIEAPLDASKVMVICASCNKGVRVGHTYNADGTKSRVCRNCGNILDNDTDRHWLERRAPSDAS